jgi:hypothetical protein
VRSVRHSESNWRHLDHSLPGHEANSPASRYPGLEMDDPSQDALDVFVGGANVPWMAGMRINVTWPLATLWIGHHDVCLRGRGPIRRVVREMVALSSGVTAKEVRVAIVGGALIQRAMVSRPSAIINRGPRVL